MSIPFIIGTPILNVNRNSYLLISKNIGMSIGERIREARKISGLTQKELAFKVGMKQPTLSELETGESAGTTNLASIASALGVNALWLETGKGKPVPNKEAPALHGDNVEPGPSIRNDREYPVISWVQAGEWTALSDNFAPGDAEDWRPSHKNLGKHGYILRVKGKSMTTAEGSYSFPDGILLYVNPDAEILPDKFVIVRRNSTKEATFKRYVMVDNEQYLEALNPDWPNRYLKLEEGDEFCGVVLSAGFDMP